MSVLLTLLALLAPLERAPPGSEEVSLCQTTALTIGARSAWVNLTLDEDGRQVDNQLVMRGVGFDATWRLGPRLLAGRDALVEFEASLDLPAGTAFPVTLRAFAGGRPIWSRRAEQSDDRIFMSTDPTNPIPNLYGTTRLRLVAEDAAGRAVASVTLVFPDWSRVERGTRRAMRHNERLARGRVEGDGCGPAGPII